MPQAKIGVIGGVGYMILWYRTICRKSAIIGLKDLMTEDNGESKRA